jgi:hypothetical protein
MFLDRAPAWSRSTLLGWKTYGLAASLRSSADAAEHVAELPVIYLRERLSPHAFIKTLGPQFRCRECRHKGAEVDARGALGYYG